MNRALTSPGGLLMEATAAPLNKKELLTKALSTESACSSASSSSSSSAYSSLGDSRRESLNSESDDEQHHCPRRNNVIKTSSDAASSALSSSSGVTGSSVAASSFLGTSPFSALLSSEDEALSPSSYAAPSTLKTNPNGSSGCVADQTALLSSSAPDGAKQVANAAQQTQQRRRKKKKRLGESLSCTTFKDVYYTTGEVLGEGSYGRVETCINMYNDVEYAVKTISKRNWCFSRSKVLKEIELYYLCQGQQEIIQLVEYFEEPEFFYLIFEKAHGGPLLSQIQSRVRFTEAEAAAIVRELATALRFLHERGIAHRDLKPENVLCVSADGPLRGVKLCDFDLCSAVNQTMTTPLLQSPVGSAEYMAPEVVNAFSSMDLYDDFEDELTYDKKCDLWSLGIIAYILLCGYLPFSGHCGNEGCMWENGGECSQCQRSLFDSIRSGQLIFPDQPWESVSASAKDLISKLLVKEASERLDAASVLAHPWVRDGGASPQRILETPRVLRKQSSVKEFSELAGNALAIKRNFETSMANNNLLLPIPQGHYFQRHHRSAQFVGRGGGGGGGSAAVRKTSAHVMAGAVTAALLSPNSISGAAAAAASKMRRQTSLIFPEEVNDNYRCEV